MDVQNDIPNKSLFKMDEVCGLTGVKPYVLRFWESEFHEIRPVTSSTGQKFYGPKDVEVVASIKKLLFEEKLTVEKAKVKLREIHHEKSNDVIKNDIEVKKAEQLDLKMSPPTESISQRRTPAFPTRQDINVSEAKKQVEDPEQTLKKSHERSKVSKSHFDQAKWLVARDKVQKLLNYAHSLQERLDRP